MRQKNYFIFHNHQLLLEKQGDNFGVLSFDTLPEWLMIEQSHLLGTYNNCECYVAKTTQNYTEKNYSWYSLKPAIEALSAEWYGIAARAYQIIQWDDNHQCCGKCGKKTVRIENQFERCCRACHLSFFPKISPAIIV